MMACRTCKTPLPDGAHFCAACGTPVADECTASSAEGDATSIATLTERLVRTLAGRYAVRQLLGSGGMAAVFLADDLALERPVAIKVLPPELARDARLIARFEREAKTAAALDHPNIIPIYRVESEGGLHYFVMKYVSGQSLEMVLEREGSVPIPFALRILTEAGAALGHAHRRGIVHRDVKPANIMLDDAGRVILTDFGISKAFRSTSGLTRTGIVVGTPYYMAPEQALGRDVDGRVDQYALAIVGLEMFTGHRPFAAETPHAVIYQQIYDEAPAVSASRPDVPAHIDRAITRALAKEPDDRFPTIDEFVAALNGSASVVMVNTPQAPHERRSIEGHPPLAPTQPIARPASDTVLLTPRRLSRGRKLAWTTISVFLVGGIVGVGLLARPGAHRGARSTPDAAPEPRVTRNPGPRLSDALAAVEAPPPAHPVPDRTVHAATSDTAIRTSASTAAAMKAPAAPHRALSSAHHELRATPAADDEHATPHAEQHALLTVVADPWGTLYVNGVEVGPTPVAEYPLDVGRQYELRVEQEGYKPKRETIAVTDPNPIRRRYILERSTNVP